MDDEQLISEVREHPCLYNTWCADFKVLPKKENAWKLVSTATGVPGKLPYSGFLLREKTFANCLKIDFRGKLSRIATDTRNSRKFSPAKETRYTVFILIIIAYEHCIHVNVCTNNTILHAPQYTRRDVFLAVHVCCM